MEIEGWEIGPWLLREQMPLFALNILATAEGEDIPVDHARLVEAWLRALRDGGNVLVFDPDHEQKFYTAPRRLTLPHADEEVIASQQYTVLDEDAFDALSAALDRPATPNAPLRDAVRRPRRFMRKWRRPDS